MDDTWTVQFNRELKHKISQIRLQGETRETNNKKIRKIPSCSFPNSFSGYLSKSIQGNYTKQPLWILLVNHLHHDRCSLPFARFEVCCLQLH